MKKFLKIIGIGFGIIIVMGVVAMFTAGGETEPASSEPKTEKTDTETATKEKDIVKKPGKAEFEQVKNGMTIEEVEKILGPGSMDAESESGNVKIQMYSWQAKGDLGANITVSFMNGKVDTKAQFGIK
jgi:hypothetical protein